MQIVYDASSSLGVEATCMALGVSRASYYRELQPVSEKKPRPPSPRALSTDERQCVLELLRGPRFVDLAPAEVYSTLLDEGRHVASERTMYRLLAANREVRERRDQLCHPKHPIPQLLATRPNQLWSWDITKLLGPAKWTYFYLYVILDVFSRYVVGWMIAHRESAALAEKLIRETTCRWGIGPGELTIHADRGTSMKSKPVALLLSDLGVTKTHSRPHVSNDNPYSEAHFKTLKYRPDYPDRFGCIEDARHFHVDFFSWYNNDHHHGGLGLLTPHVVHHGLSEVFLLARTRTLAEAYRLHPERFPNGTPRPASLPSEVWINKPSAAIDMASQPAKAEAGRSDPPQGVAPPEPPRRSLANGRLAHGTAEEVRQ